MLHVILCCASGMSSRLLVQKIKKAADEKEFDLDIQVVNCENLSDSKADLMLLAPQVSHMKKSLEQNLPHMPVEVIGLREYGMLDGNKVFQQILDSYHSNENVL